MKKLIYTLVSVVLVSLTACQNDNSVNPRPVDQIVGKVTISGKVKADLNQANNTPTFTLENAPSGLKIVARVLSSDLVLNTAGVTYPYKYYEATVNASGEYSIEVEAGPKGSNVVLYFPDFRADVTTATTPISTLFNGASVGLFVNKGVNEIVDFTY